MKLKEVISTEFLFMDISYAAQGRRQGLGVAYASSTPKFEILLGI